MKNQLHSYLLIFCFALMAFNTVQAQKLKVGIIPIGKVNPEHIEIAKKSLEDFYHTKVSTAAALPIHPDFLSLSGYFTSPITVQVLNTDATNKELLLLGSKKYDVMIGITDSAITIGEKLMASNMQNLNKALIQGITESTLKAATISTYKLAAEAKDKQTFAADLAKVARHEMGHILGLPHCSTKQCLMLGAYQFKNASSNFCPACLEKIDKKHMKKPVLTAYKGSN